MADKVKPLKIEDATSGSQNDGFPVETNPTQDYLAAKGVAFENNDNRLIDLDGSGNIQFKDFTEAAYVQLWKLRRALYQIFDPTGSALVSTNAEDAIKELEDQVNTSASPGFSFGRAGTVTAGTYLQNETVPSNITGRWVYINSAFVTRVFVSNETTTTYKLQFYYHDGNGAGLTSLGTVTVTAAKGAAFSVNWSVPTGKQIAARIATDSANSVKNIVCGLELAGTT